MTTALATAPDDDWQEVTFDDVQGTLDLPFEPRLDPPVIPDRVAGRTPDPTAGVVPIDRRARRDIEAWACRFTQAAVEIVGGDRPSHQLVRWTTEPVYAELERRAAVVARAGRHLPGAGRVQPVRPRVATAHACFLTPGVVEVAVHVRFGARSRAVAARFERSETNGHREGGAEPWLCTALEFV